LPQFFRSLADVEDTIFTACAAALHLIALKRDILDAGEADAALENASMNISDWWRQRRSKKKWLKPIGSFLIQTNTNWLRRFQKTE